MSPETERLVEECLDAYHEQGGPPRAYPTPRMATAWRRLDFALTAPVPMVLHCPSCHEQHIDESNEEQVRIEAAERGFEHGSRDWELFIDKHVWTNPPHRSHLCAKCGTIWRPSDVATVGVRHIETRGEHDTLVYRRGPT